MTASAPPSAPQRSDPLNRASIATFVAFTGSGLALSSWLSRIPQLRDQLRLDPFALGLVLFAVAAGSLLALPLAGPVIARVGSRRVVGVAGALAAAALAGVAGGQLVGVVPVVAALFVLGVSMGAWDVAMNVHGAMVEQRLERSIMSRYHAIFSVGAVAGAVIGSGMVALGVPVVVHLGAVAVIVCVAVVGASRSFLIDQTEFAASSGTGPESSFAAWREPRTLLIGVFVLAFTFAEGVGSDWITVAIIDGHGGSPATAALAFATFLAAMTAGRWFGPTALDRYGRAAVVRALAVAGIAGTVLFVAAPGIPVAFVGAALWGLGASLGFPVGVSAGADDPARAAGRVSVISSIGYTAFLAGPPLIGFLGDQVTVLRAVAVVAAPFALSLLIAGAVRPRRDAAPNER